MKNLNALTIAHNYLGEHIKEGDTCIDATMGRGRDALFLAELVGATGEVLAFDIQQQALDSTKKLLQENEKLKRVKLILDSHSNMGNYAKKESVSAISFNLGWLPGGDHSVFTKPESSMEAINAGINLLKVGGIMTICIYYGKDSGYNERDRLLEFFPRLDYKKLSVLISRFVNQPNDPPIPVLIRKEKSI